LKVRRGNALGSFQAFIEACHQRHADAAGTRVDGGAGGVAPWTLRASRLPGRTPHCIERAGPREGDCRRLFWPPDEAHTGPEVEAGIGQGTSSTSASAPAVTCSNLARYSARLACTWVSSFQAATLARCTIGPNALPW
jgi:hypothetical protein